MNILSQTPHTTIPDVAASLGITTRAVEKQIAALKKQGRVRRIGPNKGGHWETMDNNLWITCVAPAK